MGGNIPGGNFLDVNFLGGTFQGGGGEFFKNHDLLRVMNFLVYNTFRYHTFLQVFIVLFLRFLQKR